MKAAQLTPVNATEVFYCPANSYVTNWLLLNEQKEAAYPLRHGLRVQ